MLNGGAFAYFLSALEARDDNRYGRQRKRMGANCLYYENGVNGWMAGVCEDLIREIIALMDCYRLLTRSLCFNKSVLHNHLLVHLASDCGGVRGRMLFAAYSRNRGWF
jgi:hypothetical protein